MGIPLVTGIMEDREREHEGGEPGTGPRDQGHDAEQERDHAANHDGLGPVRSAHVTSQQQLEGTHGDCPAPNQHDEQGARE